MTKSREYERFMLDSSPVLRDNAVDESQEVVTLMTEQKVSCIIKPFPRFARLDIVKMIKRSMI